MNHNDATPELIGKPAVVVNAVTTSPKKDATPELIGKPVAVDDVVAISLKKRQAQRIDVPAYDDLELNTTSAAILPCDFMPTMIEKLPEHWFYVAYRWYTYFDKDQRTESGGVASSKILDVSDPNNVANWKDLASRMFDQSFKEEGKVQ